MGEFFEKIVKKDWEKIKNVWGNKDKNLNKLIEKIDITEEKYWKNFYDDYKEIIKNYKEKGENEVWLYGNWKTSIENGFKVNKNFDENEVKEGRLIKNNSAISIIDLEKQHLIDNIDIEDDDFKKWNKLRDALRYLSSDTWHISTRGYISEELSSFLGVEEIKTVLRVAQNVNWSDNPEIAKNIYERLQKKFEKLIQEVKNFSGDDLWDIYKNWVGEGNENNKIASLLAHFIYPHLFPVFFKTTTYGYSQLKGLRRLLKLFFIKGEFDIDISKIEELINSLEVEKNYETYSRVYRILLYCFGKYLQGKKELKGIPFDIFTQFLADIERTVDPLNILKSQKVLIFYGVPGTGKTYTAKKMAEELIRGKNDQKEDDQKRSDQIEVIQFHPSYQYTDFVIGIKPTVNPNGDVIYSVVPGIFYKICAKACNDCKKNYVLIIDEINRANLAEVFGELLYCLEYRCSKNDNSQDKNFVELSITNPQKFFEDELGTEDPFMGGKKFCVPENLYLIGTMNHADRSLSGIDMAMRRRFAWYKLEYSRTSLREMIIEKIEKIGEKKLIIPENLNAYIERTSQLNDLIKSRPNSESRDKIIIQDLKINEQKDKLKSLPLNEDHHIGHTYFAKIVEFLNELPANKILDFHLEGLWVYYLQPLLEDFLGVEIQDNEEALFVLKNWFCKELK